MQYMYSSEWKGVLFCVVIGPLIKYFVFKEIVYLKALGHYIRANCY